MSLPIGGIPYFAIYTAGANVVSGTSPDVLVVLLFLGMMLFLIVDEVARPLEYPIVVLEAVIAAVCRIGDGLVGGRVFFLPPRREDGILALLAVVKTFRSGAVDDGLG